MKTPEFNFDGGCTCGQLRYQMNHRPLFIHCCHCRWCQRETGASFALNALIEANNVTLLRGMPESIHTPSFSGLGQKIWRCPTCKIALWSNYAGSGDLIRFVRVGTLDDPDQFPPNIHIFTQSKQPWVIVPMDIPSVKAYYNLADYWPDDSLRRRETALNLA